MEFHHLGIIVDDLKNSTIEFEESIGGSKEGKEILDEGIGVTIQFIKDPSGILYELVQPIDEDSKIFSVLKTNNHLHHIAYKVDLIEERVKELRNNGFGTLTKLMKAKAFENKRVVFLLSPNKYIVELVEA